MNFAPDTFESIHRRKRLAAWLGTLKGPKKRDAQAELDAALQAAYAGNQYSRHFDAGMTNFDSQTVLGFNFLDQVIGLHGSGRPFGYPQS